MTDGQDIVRQLGRLDLGLVSRLALDALSLFEQAQDEAATASAQIQADVRSVRNALVDLIERSGRCPSEIISVLGALHDPELIPLFRRCLSWQIASQDAGGVYAALQALDQLGEEVFVDRPIRSIFDWELNRRLALAYLGRNSDLQR